MLVAAGGSRYRVQSVGMQERASSMLVLYVLCTY